MTKKKEEQKGYSWENRRKYLKYTLLFLASITTLLTISIVYLGYTTGNEKAIDSQVEILKTIITLSGGLLVSYFGFASYENRKG